MPSRSSPTVSGAPRRRWLPADRMGLWRAAPARQRRSSAGTIAPRSTGRRRPRATTATLARRCASAAARWSRRSTRCRIWRMRRWSRSTARRRSGPTASTSGSGTQNPEAALQLAAKAAGVKPEKVYVHNCFLGGGFGRRAVNDELRPGGRRRQGGRQAGQADLDARRGHPARPLPPAGGHPLPGRFGADGLPMALRHPHRGRLDPALARHGRGGERHRAPGGRRAGQPALRGRRTSARRLRAQEHPCAGHVLALASAARRTPSHRELHRRAGACGRARIPTNSAARCSTDRPDFVGVLDNARGEGRLGQAAAAGKGRGIAIHESFGTIVGQIAEVAVDGKARSRSSAWSSAVDCGHVVNPRTVEMQIESAMIYGLTAALTARSRSRTAGSSRAISTTTRWSRMADAPRIETHLALSGGKNGAASASPARRRSRPRSPTRSSPPRASASARCRFRIRS